MWSLLRADGVVVPITRRLVAGRDATACSLVTTTGGRRQFALSEELVLEDLAGGTTCVNGTSVGEDKPRIREGDVVSFGTSETFRVVLGMQDEKTRLAREKIARLALESERIRSKEHTTDLTEGQRRVLERNEAEIQRLEESLVAKAQQQQQHVLPDGSHAEWEGDEGLVARDEDEDGEFFDRTAYTTKSAATGAAPLPPVHTFESLSKRMHEINATENEVNTKLADLRQTAPHNGNGRGGEEEEEDVDPLDQFMAENDRELKSSDLDKYEKQLEALKAERDTCNRLLDIVRPAHVPKNELAAVAAAPRSSNKSSSSGSNSIIAPAPPPSSKEQYRVISDREVSTTTSTSSSSVVSVAKRMKLLPPGLTKNPNSAPPQSHKSTTGLPFEEMTVEALLAEAAEMPAAEKEEDNVAWVPPKAQTGDGKTSLNSRFGY